MAPGENGFNRKINHNHDSGFVRMRCPHCGLVVQGAPERFQDTLKCPNCEQDVIFLRMAETAEASPQKNVFDNFKDLLPKDKNHYR